ncbi:MAG: uracil-DNA glycosylase [Nitrososphaeria archaeon]|nr:uracil-DNA glycosylase [Nitrososphaeria archaeon]MDW8021195.1 uracil-DNA glycosylase [Nitrososphaerota archaeon]
MESRIQRLEILRREVENCRKCSLWRTRKSPVFGEGPPDAGIMLVGLGPGKQEDLQGRPFVGAAGKFLDELLEEAGLKRNQLYITNVMKCFLPDNRASDDQVKMCSPYLDGQIEVIQPKLIIALGNLAASYLLGKSGLKPESMEKIHGKIYDASTLTLTLKIATMYHPASALRNPGLKDMLIEDWRKLGVGLRELKLI